MAAAEKKGSGRPAKEAGVTTMMEKDPVVQGDLLARLKKVEGQVRGVQKMIQDCRDCGDIVTQLAAIKSAVNRVSITVLACHLADQIKNDLHQEKDMKESLAQFMEVFKKFS